MQERAAAEVLAQDARAAPSVLDGVGQYVLLINIIKGVTFYSAADAAVELWRADRWTIEVGLLWAASFLAMLVTYHAITVGTSIVSWPPTLTDMVLPFLLGIVEYSLFAVLKPPANPYAWYYVFLGFFLVGCLICTHVVRSIREPRGPTLAYKTWTLHNIRFTAGSMCGLALLIIAAQLRPGLLQWTWVSAIAVLALQVASVAQNEVERIRWERQWKPARIPQGTDLPIPVDGTPVGGNRPRGLSETVRR
jgi:hypothetical protein